jgi:hypothetical protein
MRLLGTEAGTSGRSSVSNPLLMSYLQHIRSQAGLHSHISLPTYSTPIMQAGAECRLMRLTYDGVRRDVEPYSLAYKQRTDGHREEYLYVYDRTGGRTSGPGLKSFFNYKIHDLQVLDEFFEPRHPINLAKAGEFTGPNYFSQPFGSGRSGGGQNRPTLRHSWRYTVQCSYCLRTFKRMRRNTTLKPHKDGYGNNCFGRRGVIIDQHLV